LIASKIAKVDSEFSVVCHGTDVLIPPHPMITTHINKYVLRNSDKIFAVSSQIKDKIISFGVDENKIFLGQYGIDVKFENLEKDIDIISNRTYESNSRIDMMLDHLKELDDLKLNMVFVLPDVTDEEYEILVQKYKNVTFYKPIPYKDLLNLVNRSKIYISATKSDGTSLSLMEAMSLKCIPLVSDIVSNRSLVLDGINGFLFYTKDQFLDRIRYILDNYDELYEVIPKINEDVIKKDGQYMIQMKKMENFLK
jgi:glycosyltransferase involved in cell wall biosynthesis